MHNFVFSVHIFPILSAYLHANFGIFQCMSIRTLFISCGFDVASPSIRFFRTSSLFHTILAHIVKISKVGQSSVNARYLLYLNGLNSVSIVGEVGEVSLRAFALTRRRKQKRAHEYLTCRNRHQAKSSPCLISARELLSDQISTRNFQISEDSIRDGRALGGLEFGKQSSEREQSKSCHARGMPRLG